MNAYTALFPDSRILDIERHGKEDSPEQEGSVKVARFTLNGMPFMAMDSLLDHQFAFTPAMSLFVECESEVEMEKAFESLSEGGKVFMPLDDYGFSARFGWIEDRYGVSWQLNLVS